MTTAEIMKQARDALDAAIREKNTAQALIKSIGPAVIESLKPVLAELSANARLTKQDIVDALAQIQIHVPPMQLPSTMKVDVPKPEVTVNVPEIKIPEIKLPTINVPRPEVTVNVPPIKIPNVIMPDVMRVLLDSISRTNPLPVQMVDPKGNPYYPASNDRGGGGPQVIRDMLDYRGISLIDSTTTPGTPVLRTSATVTFPTSSLAAALVDSSGVQYSGSNPLPITGSISVSSGPTGPGDGAVALRIIQAGDTVSSVSVTSITGPIGPGDAASALRVLLAGNADSSVVVNSGTLTAVTTVGGITNSVQAALIDSGGVQYSGSNPVPVGGTLAAVTAVTSITNSVAVVALDRDGNPLTTGPIGQGDSATALRVVQANDVASSVSITSITGPIGAGDSSAALRILHAGDAIASVQTQFIARTSNPTATADGSPAFGTSDKLGRQLVRPMQVRDLISTARVNVVTGTEVTLLAAAGAGVFLDCISVLGANNSVNAIKADFRAVTAGNIEFTLNIPASATAGIVHAVPWPQSASNNNWTVDLSDDTHDVTFSALFSKEI